MQLYHQRLLRLAHFCYLWTEQGLLLIWFILFMFSYFNQLLVVAYNTETRDNINLAKSQSLGKKQISILFKMSLKKHINSMLYGITCRSQISLCTPEIQGMRRKQAAKLVKLFMLQLPPETVSKPLSSTGVFCSFLFLQNSPEMLCFRSFFQLPDYYYAHTFNLLEPC